MVAVHAIVELMNIVEVLGMDMIRLVSWLLATDLVSLRAVFCLVKLVMTVCVVVLLVMCCCLV